MRELTLNEKITFKGALFNRGMDGPELKKLTMSSLIHYWKIFYSPYKPLAHCFKISKFKWRKIKEKNEKINSNE